MTWVALSIGEAGGDLPLNDERARAISPDAAEREERESAAGAGALIFGAYSTAVADGAGAAAGAPADARAAVDARSDDEGAGAASSGGGRDEVISARATPGSNGSAASSCSSP